MGGGHRSRKRNSHKTPGRAQVSHTFAPNERVLCYEPDMKKARVLYDSKVLEVVERQQKGKTVAEYKIHFFGWNSSWDRYVTEECVLKDTEENRELQRDLKSKADALLEGHVKKKKRKKTLSEILKEVTKDKNGKGDAKKGSAGDTKNEDDSSNSSGSSESSGEEDSDEEKDVPQIFLTEKVKAILEQDYFNLMTRNMLVRIPAEVSVVCVFEGYVKFIGFRELRKVVEQHKSYFSLSTHGASHQASTSSSTLSSTAFSLSGANTKTLNQSKGINEAWAEDVAKIYRKVRQAQEIVHGLKVIFDYMLYQMLLYDLENEQYKSHKRMRPRMPDINCNLLVPQLPVPGLVVIEETGAKKKQPKKGDQEKPSTSKSARSASRDHNSETLNKLRKHSKGVAEEKERKSDRKVGDLLGLSASVFDSTAWTKAINKYVNELRSWQMLPEECYQQETPDPCMVYGLIHVLRFFVKLPDILNRMLIPRRKVRIIANHVNQMMDHIQTSYVFSISRLYVSIPRHIYEEDQIRIAAPPPEVKQPEMKPEVDRDFSQYSTRNHQLVPLVKARPQLPKVVEVPLSTASDTLEEHQLTIRSEISLEIPIPRSSPIEGSEDTAEKASSVPSNPVQEKEQESSSCAATTEKAPHTSVPEKLKELIKKEPVSPPIQPEKVATNDNNNTQQQSKKSKSTAKPSVSPPVQPMVRQVRKSAAHAAFKNAHLFASQQHLTARTIAASTSTAAAAAANTVVKQEPVEEEHALTSSKKRSLPSDAPVSEAKRITRMSDNKVLTCAVTEISSPNKSFSTQNRKSRQEQRSSGELDERQRDDNTSSSKSPQGRRTSSSPVRKSRNSIETDDHNCSNTTRTRSRRTSSPGSRSSLDNRRRNRSKGGEEIETKYSPSATTNASTVTPNPEKTKVEAKRISSPRTSKSSNPSSSSSSGNKDSRSPTKTPQKSSISPTSTNTIRLRSRSDERQLRSKGALINALSLPMQSTMPSRSSSSAHHTNTRSAEDEKSSPRRRESTGNNKDSDQCKRGQNKRYFCL